MKPQSFSALITYLSLFIVSAGCSSTGPDYDPEVEPGVYRFDFETGAQGWEALFVGVPVESNEYTDLEVLPTSDHRSLPKGIDRDGKALFVTGESNGPGMGLYLKRSIEGLTPGATYDVYFDVKMATQTPNCLIGIGGGSGGTRAVAAAISEEPTRIREDGRYVDMYVLDEGSESDLDFPPSSSEPSVLGTTANGIPCEQAREMNYPWRLKRLKSGSEAWSVKANENGKVWVLVGTWSAYYNPLSFYYDEIAVRFEEQE